MARTLHRLALSAPRLAMLAGLAASVPAFAETPPKIWTWSSFPATGEHAVTANVDYIKPMVRVYVDTDATTTGAKVAAMIDCLKLEAGEVAILLQNFGSKPYSNFALTLNDGDALGITSTYPGEEGWRTTWMSDGINAASAWMDDFINECVSLAIPEPSRFVFDLEEHAILGTHPSPCCPIDIVQVYDFMKAETRWDNEAIPGFSGDTMDDIADGTVNYLGTGVDEPTYDVMLNVYHTDNRPWLVWYGGLCNQAADAALKEAAYDLVYAEWGNDVLCSNYLTSVRVDGVSSRTYRSNDSWGAAGWNQSIWKGSSDRMAPEMYPVHKDYCACTPSTNRALYWDANLAQHRRNLDAMINSFGGDHSDELAPWIIPPLVGADVGEVNVFNVNVPFVASMDEHRLFLALLRSKGVREMYGFESVDYQCTGGAQYSPETCPPCLEAEHWDELDALVTQVWAYDATGVVTSPYCPSFSDGGDKVARSDYSLITMGGGGCSAAADRTCNVAFTNSLDDASDDFIVIAETWNTAAEGSAGVIEVYDWAHSEWDHVGDFDPAAVAPGYVRTAPFGPRTDYVSGGVSIVRITHSWESTNTATVSVDMVQLLGAGDVSDATAPDLSWARHMHTVNAILGAMGDRAADRRTDLNGDRVVDPLDLVLALQRFSGE